jgi:hypothetical protein
MLQLLPDVMLTSITHMHLHGMRQHETTVINSWGDMMVVMFMW